MSSVLETAVRALITTLCAVWLCNFLPGRHGGGQACSAESGTLTPQQSEIFFIQRKILGLWASGFLGLWASGPWASGLRPGLGLRFFLFLGFWAFLGLWASEPLGFWACGLLGLGVEPRLPKSGSPPTSGSEFLSDPKQREGPPPVSGQGLAGSEFV